MLPAAVGTTADSNGCDFAPIIIIIIFIAVQKGPWLPPSRSHATPSASQVQPAPHVLHVLQVSLLDFLTAVLHRLCGRCLNRRGNRTWFSVYLPLISAVHTPAVPPTAPPPP